MTESGLGTDPSDAESTAETASDQRHPGRPRWIIAAVLAGLLVIGAIIWAVIALKAPDKQALASPSAQASVLASPSAPPMSSNEPTTAPAMVSPSPTATVPTLSLPADCQAIYSGPMFSSLRALELPLNDPSLADETGTAIPELDTLLRANPGLHCSWGLPSELGINTNVTLIDPAAAQNIEAALVARGATCEDKDDGTLCTLIHVGPGVEGWAEGDPQAGENHFFRDNAWIATHWSTVEMNGYTPDIVHTLWP
ncbi:hypothetical protein [Mycetocola saprophilus]|uniref:hypothetical protein n=1 Tax=Mycetocola saprophilus TaxID=76636 RepID=UPI003BEFAA61